MAGDWGQHDGNRDNRDNRDNQRREVARHLAGRELPARHRRAPADDAAPPPLNRPSRFRADEGDWGADRNVARHPAGERPTRRSRYERDTYDDGYEAYRDRAGSRPPGYDAGAAGGPGHGRASRYASEDEYRDRSNDRDGRHARYGRDEYARDDRRGGDGWGGGRSPEAYTDSEARARDDRRRARDAAEPGWRRTGASGTRWADNDGRGDEWRDGRGDGRGDGQERAGAGSGRWGDGWGGEDGWGGQAWSPPGNQLAHGRGGSAKGARGKPAGTQAEKQARKRGLRGRWPGLSRRQRVVTLLLIGVVLLCSLAGSVDAYARYANMSGLAREGVRHLRNAQKVVSTKKAAAVLFDAAARDSITQELTAAERDFRQLRAQLASPGGTVFAADAFPLTGGTVRSAANLAGAADEATLAGLELLKVGPVASAWLEGGIFAQEPASGTTGTTGTAPKAGGITQEQLQQISTYVNAALQHVHLAITLAAQADLSVLPGSLVSDAQRAQLEQMLQNKGQLQAQLDSFGAWMRLLPTLLGVTAPQQMLLMLQDRSELRPTGGFMGNYSVLTIRNGQLLPFTLKDTYSLDTPYTAANGTLPLPDGYSWYPFQPFALRDANLNADFPTSAKLAIKMFKQESGTSVQGMIVLTPAVIQSILKAVGEVKLADYGETVTASNLESLIHKHQLDVDVRSGSRKAFTASLAQEVMKRLKALPRPQFLSLALDDMRYLQTKDVQIYLADPRAQALLHQGALDGAITTGPGDGVTVVDSNVGGNKASQYTTVKYTDSVTVDAQGTATHRLQITYNFRAKDVTQLYGPAYYKVYLRVYVPPQAKLSSASGFLADSQPNAFGKADIPDRAMVGGYVLVDDGTPRTVKLVWSVPNIAADGGRSSSYQLTYQHQAGSQQALALTAQLPGNGKPVTVYDGTLDMDKRFNLSY